MAKKEEQLDVVIVGGGAAGLGMAAVLRDLGIERFVVLERSAIGASFLRWSKQTRFITPSFNSNQFGSLDLNAVCLHTSPAYSVGTEHPSGQDYADYLRGVAKYFELPVETGVEVQSVVRRRVGRGFRVQTSGGVYDTRFVIWAAGEFQYPHTNGFPGAELCVHSSKVTSWPELNGSERVIIGGAESGVDGAVALADAGRRAVVLDAGAPWDRHGPDPSQLLSPFTKARLEKAVAAGRVDLRGERRVTKVSAADEGFSVELENGETIAAAEPPILASGFAASPRLIADLFHWRGDGFPSLTESDESTRTRGLFLVGPQVRQDDIIFCFIYKFRQRFAVVANQIARRMRVSVKPLEEYRKNGMFLDDLSCCGDDCAC